MWVLSCGGLGVGSSRYSHRPAWCHHWGPERTLRFGCSAPRALRCLLVPRLCPWGCCGGGGAVVGLAATQAGAEGAVCRARSSAGQGGEPAGRVGAWRWRVTP